MENFKELFYSVFTFTEYELEIFIGLIVCAFVALFAIFYIAAIGLTDYKGFTRADLKLRGKKSISNGKFWGAFWVSIVGSFLGAGSSVDLSYIFSESESELNMSYNYAEINNFIYDNLKLILLVSGLVIVASFALTVFLTNIVNVSLNRYFIKNLDSRPVFNELFWGFRNGKYIKICTTMFFHSLYIMLWSLLFVIPGIIKAYQYYMVPYIVAENPDIDRKDAFRLSTQMMKGNKWKTFVLELSFFGWFLLGAFAFGIGGFFVAPYVHSTFAALYERLRLNIPETERYAYLSNDIFRNPEDSEPEACVNDEFI